MFFWQKKRKKGRGLPGYPYYATNQSRTIDFHFKFLNAAPPPSPSLTPTPHPAPRPVTKHHINPCTTPTVNIGLTVCLFQCPGPHQRCVCSFGGGAPDLPVNSVPSEDDDRRSVGLAGATGALGGVLATGSALAAYFHFRGGGGGGLPGGGSGGGIPEGGDGGEFPGRTSSPRPESSLSSTDSYSSESPLTRRDNRMYESRFRPFTRASTASSTPSNIYRHARVWPGRF